MTDKTGAAPARAGCGGDETRLSDFLDSRWGPGSTERDDIESHLAQCPQCAEELEDYRAISAAAKLLREVEVPPLDAERMRAGVRSCLRRCLFWRRVKWTGAGLSVAAAAALALVLILQPAETPPPQADRGGDEAVPPARVADEAGAIPDDGTQPPAMTPERFAEEVLRARMQAEIERRRREGLPFGERDLFERVWSEFPPPPDPPGLPVRDKQGRNPDVVPVSGGGR